MPQTNAPSVVLLCHHDEPIDREGLAGWLATSMRLAGLVVIHDGAKKRWRTLDRERRRTGWRGVADTLAFRIYYGLVHARRDARWRDEAVRVLRHTYPADLAGVPRIDVTNPNSPAVETFLRGLAPDFALARCKHLLKRAVFEIPRFGTFVCHPGICPEYRNAHGCFWALVQRDMARVGMTLLRIDTGVDTGQVFLQAGYAFDERSESHYVIQQRVVLENLDAIAGALCEIAAGTRAAIDTAGRASATWGQPRLSAHLRWKRAARRTHHEPSHLSAVS